MHRHRTRCHRRSYSRLIYVFVELGPSASLLRRILVVAREVRIGLQTQVVHDEDRSMQTWIRHCDAQSILQKLSMPFISVQSHPANIRPDAQDICITVDDDDTEMLQVVVAAEADRARSVPVPAQNIRQPLATLDLSVPEPRAILHRSTSGRSITTTSTTNSFPSRQRSASMSEQCGSQSQGDPADDGEENDLAVVELSTVSAGTRIRRWTAAAMRTLSQQDYENMPPAQRSFVAAKSSQALDQLTQKHLTAQKQLRALKRANKAQAESLVKKQKLLEEARATSSLHIVTTGQTGKRVTTQSTFAIGVRRNLSNISAADFGATVLHDLSRMRVTRAEVRTAAAILCRMKQAVSSVVFADASAITPVAPPAGSPLPRICDPAEIGIGDWQLSVISIRCDATNSSIWRREKLHVLDLDFAWVLNTEAVRKFDAKNAFACVRCLCGTQQVCQADCVRDSDMGHGTRSCKLKLS